MAQDLQAQLLKDLVEESLENLEQFDRDLLAVEQGEANSETLHSMFRVIHTIKGTSGCLGLGRIESVAHAGENLLASVREGKVAPHPGMITTLLAYADALREMLRAIGATGSEGDGDYSSLVADLGRLNQACSPAAAVQAGSAGLFSDEEAPPAVDAPAIQPEAAPGAAETSKASVSITHASESAIRVDVVQLDTLMDLVGELVLARNQIIQLATELRESGLVNATQRLNHITTKLQENVMKTRMQPIGNVWAKFPRVVRDVSHELNKQVRLVMEGSETELDRTIIEAIKDPLTHLVRNAIDHGLEAPNIRVAQGKPAEGTLRLRAFHEGGQVIIEISDDGAGIDRERVRRKAVQRGLVGDEQSLRLSDRELFSLLFAPGFSTAEKVTNLSGRGVGMDVVKKNIEKIGGSVDVQSEAGRSTSIRLKIPLTLAIIPALIIRCGRNRYAVPQASLIELVRIDADQATSQVEYIDAFPVFRLRGSLLPLVNLRDELRIPGAGPEAGDSLYLLVLQAEGRQFGLVVDSISDTEEIVVKPLGKELKNLSVYAGATIMGDGKVALILDVIGIARRANVITEAREQDLRREQEAAERNQEGERQSLLLVAVGGSKAHQVAIPLPSVARLEEFPASKVEWAGSSEVVQYRQEIMPLVRVGEVLSPGRGGEGGDEAAETLRVVVYDNHGRNIGLVVDQIIDTVEASIRIQRCSNRRGIIGSAVVQQRVTDFLDTESLIAASGVVEFETA